MVAVVEMFGCPYAYQHDVDDWPEATRTLLRERGQTMEMAARKVFEQGIIDERTFNLVSARAEAGGH